MCSGHPSALYERHLAGWQRPEMQVTTQGHVRTEVVWFNVEPNRVHWASCAGRNFTHRQTVKRKAASWPRRYQAMPPDERLAVLAGSLDRLDAALKEIDRLHERVTELERHIALDITNSSKPPPTDGPGKKRGRNKGKRIESERSRAGGGQTTRGRRCPSCDTLTRVAFPDDIWGAVQYGRRITGMVAYLQHTQLLPEKRLSELMGDLPGVKISKATIAAMAERTTERFERLIAHLTRVLRIRVAVKHLDETPVRVDTGHSWFQVLCTPLLAAVRLGTGRGDGDRNLKGILVHDAFASYFSLEGVRHVPRHAQHLRELKALARLDGEPWA